MTTAERQLDGQTVVVIGGSSGIGLETARLAGAGGAAVVIVGRRRGPPTASGGRGPCG